MSGFSVAERPFVRWLNAIRRRRELQEAVGKRPTSWKKTSDGFSQSDRDWKFTFVNPQSEKLLRSATAKTDRQDFWVELPEFTRDAFEKNYRRAMSDK